MLWSFASLIIYQLHIIRMQFRTIQCVLCAVTSLFNSPGSEINS